MRKMLGGKTTQSRMGLVSSFKKKREEEEEENGACAMHTNPLRCTAGIQFWLP